MKSLLAGFCCAVLMRAQQKPIDPQDNIRLLWYTQQMSVADMIAASTCSHKTALTCEQAGKELKDAMEKHAQLERELKAKYHCDRFVFDQETGVATPQKNTEAK